MEVEGWAVRVLVNNKRTYGAVLSKINNKIVDIMVLTFGGCNSLIEISECNISKGTVEMFGTFLECTSLYCTNGTISKDGTVTYN